MSTYTQLYYHIVFSTKNRQPVLTPSRREDLFRYTWGIIKNHKGHLYRINSVDDHVHILSDLHPTVCLADLVKAIKTGSAKWTKENGVFPDFGHWQDGYGAFTQSHADKDAVIEYIKRQEQHHERASFVDEYRELLRRAGIAFDERYLL